VLRLLGDRRLQVFALVVVLFHLANAAQLPLMASEATAQTGRYASIVIAACIVLPQVIVAGLAPSVGRWADRWGLRPVMAVCFAAVPLRAGLLSLTQDPTAMIVVQALDGISAAGFGVLLPLVTADLTRGTNRFNLCLGVFGLMGALGATLSTAIGGDIAERAGTAEALLVLGGVGLLQIAVIVLAMPEPRQGTGEAVGEAARGRRQAGA